MPNKHHPIHTFFKRAALILFVLAGVTATASFISNQFLSDDTDHPTTLSDTEIVIVNEAMRVKKRFGDMVWPGFGSTGDGIVLINKQYAFLHGVNSPAEGFRKPPHEDIRGGAWEHVPGETYYRQPVERPDLAIGQFTVQVGERWVPSYYTRSESIISLRRMIKENLPGPVTAIIPFGLLPMIWNTDWYIMGLLHESYHAYVGNRAPDRLRFAERAVWITDERYPLDDPESEASWKRELEHWSRAIESTNNPEAADHARQALAERDNRRTRGAYDDELIRAMKEREWQEGLAKYTELMLWKLAAEDTAYRPLPAMQEVPHFKSYRTYNRRYAEELRMLNRQYSHHGDTRFYYTGMAQAMLLDRLQPDWKEQVFDDGVYLEDLLRQAVSSRDTR